MAIAKNGGRVNVLDYGVSTLSADNTVAFERALALGRPLFVPSGTYVITGQIDFTATAGVNINIRGERGTIIDASTSTATYAMNIGGSRGSGTNFSAQVEKGNTVLTNSIGATLVKGDIALISSVSQGLGVNVWSPEPGRDNYYRGEMIEVEHRSSTTVTCVAPVNDQYVTGVSMFKLTMPTVTIEHIEIIRNSNDGGIFIQYAKDLHLNHIKVRGCRERGIYVAYIFGGLIENCTVGDCQYGEGLVAPPVGYDNTQYGLVIVTVQDLTVSANRFYGGRHGLSLSGFEPTRHVTITGNTVSNYIPSARGSFDMHGIAEFIIVTNNRILNGIQNAAKNVLIQGNIIHNYTWQAGIDTGMYWALSEYLTIKDNTILSLEATAAESYGIQIRTMTNSMVIGDLVIEGNFIQSKDSCIGIYGDSSISPTNTVINKATIKNNELYTAGVYGLFSIGTGTGRITWGDLQFKNNTVRANSGGTLWIKGVSSKTAVFSNNLFETQSTGGNIPLLGIDGLTNVEFFNNIFKGPSGRSSGTNFDNIGTLTLKNNKFIRFSGPHAVGANVTELTEEGNVFEDFTSTGGVLTYSAMTGRLIIQRDGQGNVVTKGTAAPTTGTWKVSDKCWKSNPAAGDTFSGWICTTAGTPGTWKTFGGAIQA